jgi:hypothetical protein
MGGSFAGSASISDRLKETSSTTKIEMEGRDPATVATMQAVDQWVAIKRAAWTNWVTCTGGSSRIC